MLELRVVLQSCAQVMRLCAPQRTTDKCFDLQVVVGECVRDAPLHPEHVLSVRAGCRIGGRLREVKDALVAEARRMHKVSVHKGAIEDLRHLILPDLSQNPNCGGLCSPHLRDGCMHAMGAVAIQ